jgi:AraC-like DNA-binding protein
MTKYIDKRPMLLPTQAGRIIDPDLPIVSMALDIEQEQVAPHVHPRAQLLYSIRGVMRVNTPLGTWLVPPTQAVWIPSGVEHQVIATEAISLRTVFVDPSRTEGLPLDCCVTTVGPLLRELILEAVQIGNHYPPRGAERRLMEVILDQLRRIKKTPLHLPLSQEVRIRKVMDGLIVNPSDNRTIEAWALEAGASARTLSRLFRKETGMNFAAWRRQLRLLAAIERLGQGQSVTRVALDLGYRSASAFVAMFKDALGVSPKRYITGDCRI